MKKSLPFSFFGILLIVLMFSCNSKQTSTSLERVILLIWDGLPMNAIEQMPLPVMQQLATKGTFFKELHVPLPAHPSQNNDLNSPTYYPWGCSLPNPVAMTGTVFIGLDSVKECMIQHSFDQQLTAFTVNCSMYEAISVGFDEYCQLENGPADYLRDELSVEKAIGLIEEKDPAFIRIHMQGPGWAGHIVNKGSETRGQGHLKYADPNGSLPWLKDIWHPKSPYRLQSLKADSLLGVLVDWLEKNSKMEETVLLIAGDHGQADVGAHSPYEEKSSITSLLVVGKGIKQGKVYDYAEVFDIAPTIARLCQVPKPKFAIGRVLTESFINGTGQIPQDHNLQELNNILFEHHKFVEGNAQLLDNPAFRELNEQFLTIERVGVWHREFADLPSLTRHNKRCLDKLKKMVLAKN